jgi:STE24 endopeptidase
VESVKCGVRSKQFHPLIGKEKQKIARRYRSDTRKIGIASLIATAVFLMILLQFDISKLFVQFIKLYMDSRILLIVIYFSALYVVYSLLAVPFAYLEGYRIEHKYGFSTQTGSAWFADWVKSFLVTFVLGVIVFGIIFLVIPAAPAWWWLWLALIMVGIGVVLANIFPIIILPLFYKTKPLDDDDLKKEIAELCNKADLKVRGIFSIDLSSKTTKANAAVAGLGNTKRILLGDTLLSKYEKNEILSALAHEVVHYREHHTWWLILWQSMITIGMFYLFYRIQPFIYNWFGFEQASEIAAFPLFVLVFSALSYLFRPVGSALSRFYERKADKGALLLTGDADAFIRLIAKLCNKQLSIAYPHPVVEWYKYSHPSPGRRIAFGEKWKQK